VQPVQVLQLPLCGWQQSLEQQQEQQLVRWQQGWQQVLLRQLVWLQQRMPGLQRPLSSLPVLSVLVW
jgi:hypothetical protein